MQLDTLNLPSLPNPCNNSMNLTSLLWKASCIIEHLPALCLKQSNMNYKALLMSNILSTLFHLFFCLNKANRKLIPCMQVSICQLLPSFAKISLSGIVSIYYPLRSHSYIEFYQMLQEVGSGYYFEAKISGLEYMLSS